MRLDRLEQAIAVMKRAGKVDMGSWQGCGAGIQRTEAELHTCGNTACFAGWLAVSPEFQEAGGKVGPVSGTPTFKGETGTQAVIEWLEAVDEQSSDILTLLISGEGPVLDTTVEWLQSRGFQVDSEKLEPASRYSYSTFENWGRFKAQDVIKVLEALRD